MPRDIRSYFQTAKTNPRVAPAKATKRRIISSDEEDEKPPSSVKQSKKTKTEVDELHSKDVTQKIVSPADMFGKKPVNRLEVPERVKKIKKKEVESHNDVDFEATLRQLDTSDIEQKYLEETKVEKVPKVHENKEHKNTSPENKVTCDAKTVDNHKKKHETKSRKHSSTSSNEDVLQEDKKHKNTKKSPKKTGGISTMEVEHKEKKVKEKTEASDIYEERIGKRKQHAAMYQQYLQRGGARNPGSKSVPVGADHCLAGLSFLITGVLDSLEREEADELIKKYGGRILHQVSKKTDYVIIGDQPGPQKVLKANSLNIKKITEDDLLEMIRTRPAGQESDIKQSQTRSKNRKEKSTESEDESLSPPKKKKISTDDETEKESPKNKEKTKIEKHTESKASPTKDAKEIKVDTSQNTNATIVTQALVEKYRPKTMKQILGQQGDSSNAKKLHTWLANWHKNQSGQVKHAKPSPWSKNDNGAFFKAALLSGPPGIGKTTTVQVVCEELGFDLIEFNASNTRNKKMLQEEVSELLSNTTLKKYFTDAKSRPTSKQVLLMDEVDGMAGNEDRGGLQELIHFIKSTDIPIVCICNDRNHPKMRTLSNYTFDLRFPKPKLNQIRGAMKSICFKENIVISTEDLDHLIESTNQDIRQVINHLALFSGHNSQEKSAKKCANKDLKLGPWDVVKKVFSTEEMSIYDRSDLFFHDYSIGPLFVQENYLLVVPRKSKEILKRVADSAESLALGDIVEKSIRSNNAWSLLPVQAVYSSVIPGTLMSGHFTGQINFPAWLGRNSKTNKFDRLTQEVAVHARLATGASKQSVNLDYVKSLRNAVIRPLETYGVDGVNVAVDVMNFYHLLREDLDSLIEISMWPGDRDPMQSIDSKVKAAFTRSYNKNSTATSAISTSKRKTALQDDGLLGEEEEVDDEEDESNPDKNNVETDKMIKVKKTSTSKKGESKSKTDKNGAEGKSEKPKKKSGRGRGKAK